MMNNKYLLVDKKILPSCYEKVIEARALLSSGKIKDVSEAAKQVGISRSTYYKYKDYVFKFNKENINKVLFSINTIDEKGVLSSILKVISECSGNIITINQEHPVDGSASIAIAIDVVELNVTIEEFKEKIKNISGVKQVSLSLL